MSGVTWLALAVLLAVAATVTWASGGDQRRLPDKASRHDASEARRRRLALLIGLLAGGVAALLLLEPQRLGLAAVVVVALEGARRQRRRQRCRREATRTRASVVEVGEALVAELRAGRPTQSALTSVCRLWAPMAEIARAAHLDADVPGALRRLAGRPGAEGLADLAAAWELAGRTGSGLAVALDRVVGGARDANADLTTVEGELASARATGRVVAGLPLLTLGLGAGAGVGTWRWLLDTPWGIACLAAATGLALAGLTWIDRIADGVARS